MKTIRNIAVLVLALVSITNVNAQQTQQTNLYAFNKYSFNPAYAGMSGCTEVNFSHMNQWIQVNGAPTTNYLSANTRFGKSLGVGANILLDRAGMMRQFNSSVGISYGLTFAREHHVRLGISGGFFQVQIDPTEAIAFDAGDEIVDGGIQSSSALNTEAGILYAFKGLELAFSSKQLLETRSNLASTNLDGYGLARHLIGYAGYDILINKKFVLKPSVLYKGIAAANQFDINMDLNYNDFIYGGLGYRTEVGLIGRVGVNIRKLFFIGYSYEIPMQNIASYGSGSHEIALGLKFCKKQDEIIEPLIPNERLAETPVDTVTIVETIHDTLVVERVDTVFITPKAVSDAEVKKAIFNAEESLEFEYDKAIIRKESFGDLEALTNMLLVREDLTISMEGHTDSRGTAEYNMRLSKNRVEAVKKFLVANGVDASRIKTSYYGETRPIADNETEEGQRKNRRVEMKVIEK